MVVGFFITRFDIAIALMVFIGGLGTIAGPLLGALLLEPTQQYFTLQFSENGYYLILYGSLFLVVILLLPRGIIPTLQARWMTYQATRNQLLPEKDGIVITALTSQGGEGSASVEEKKGINL